MRQAEAFGTIFFETQVDNRAVDVHFDDAFDRIDALDLVTKCFKCGGTHIVSGKIKNTDDSGFVDPYFMPGHLRFLAGTFGRGARIESESYACLDCGLVSSQTDPKVLIDFIRTYRKPSDDSDLPSEST